MNRFRLYKPDVGPEAPRPLKQLVVVGVVGDQDTFVLGSECQLFFVARMPSPQILRGGHVVTSGFQQVSDTGDDVGV